MLGRPLLTIAETRKYIFVGGGGLRGESPFIKLENRNL